MKDVFNYIVISWVCSYLSLKISAIWLADEEGSESAGVFSVCIPKVTRILKFGTLIFEKFFYCFVTLVLVSVGWQINALAIVENTVEPRYLDHR